VLGRGQNFFTRIGSIFLLLVLGQVSHLWFRFGEFPFFPVDQKLPKDGLPFIYCRSTVFSGWVGSGPEGKKLKFFELLGEIFQTQTQTKDG